MILWSIGTAGHFLLTARWLKRAGTAITRDEWWFQTMVAGTGTLSIALHLIASTTGLTIARVLLVLLAGHAIAAWYVGRGFSRANSAPLKGRPTTDRVSRILETAAIVALTIVVLQWILLALPSVEVAGADAAHYHVPNAVNLALGASPFDLPATSHLYPMGSSTLAAWFILPVHTTLLIDLVMVLPFLLLMASAGWMFRQLTSVSGLAWCTWMMLALFGTPLFRSASLMSADLLFAAASVAFAAALLAPLIRRQLTPADIWLIALSLGLLLGSKVTGIVVAGLFGIPAVIALAVLTLRGKTIAAPYRMTWVWPGAAIAVIGAGGIWLVRNWWVWGSPVAPNGLTIFGHTIFPGANFEATTYNSILGDIDANAGYDLWDRARHYSGIWLSRWYLIGLGLVMLIPLDAALGWWRATPRSAPAIRLWVSIVAFGTAAVMAQFLIGAPWTSLEWTRGLSLRYALPWLAMLPVVAWVGLFPATLPWYQRTAPAIVAGVALVVGSLGVFAAHQVPAFPPLITPGALVEERHAQEARAAENASRPRTDGEQIYDATIAFEAKERRSCDVEGRRFFVTNRFDQPGSLQGARLTNRVFYAARDVKVTARVRPGMGPCDYLITERAIMDTDKGAALHAGLNPSGTLVEVATIGDVVLLVHR